jgi:hypothetical protein
MSNEDFETTTDFDIIEFAKNIINEVENIRSYMLLQTDDNTSQKIKKPIESRVNAFFRLVGLPMFVNVEKKSNAKSKENLSGERVLSPGYYGGKFNSYILQNTEENEELSFKLSEREFKLLDIENKIGSKDSNDKMTKAMAVAIPISTNITEKIGPKGEQREVFKKLLPLTTSYIKIMPVKNEVARPFLQYNKDQLPDNETILPKPFIETVIRIRLVSAANAGNANDKKRIEEEIQNNVGVEDYKNLYGVTDYILSNSQSNGMLENLILKRLLSSIPQIAEKWYCLLKRQEILYQQAAFNVSIKTNSAQNSVFGKRINTSTDITLLSKSKKGRELSELQIRLAKEQATQMLLPTEDSIYKNTDGTKNTVFTNLVAPFMKLISPDMEKIQSDIKRIENSITALSQQADQLRIELDMMTGEFIGLSIIDVIAVIIALFTIDKNDLVSLLDREARDDMQKDPVLKEALKSLDVFNIDNTKDAIFNL